MGLSVIAHALPYYRHPWRQSPTYKKLIISLNFLCMIIIVFLIVGRHLCRQIASYQLVWIIDGLKPNLQKIDNFA
ncbi:hypothetical protein HNQ55_001729 [Thalassotalea piscium]|uniref:Uncharacterized protein n=1 Tax=Thalassotalea piscium TaxID=1230533 RepID=A0A7X0NGU5_9GAMM|nr:hypothetical protein [Thalassotalea piscium]